MNVVFLITSMGSGGAERTVATVSDYMSKHGHNVTIVSIADVLFYNLGEKVEYITLRVPIYSTSFFNKIHNTVQRYFRVNKVLNKISPDVVVSILPEAAKYILTSKYALVTSERNCPGRDGNNKTKLRVFSRSDGIIFQTERAKNWYSEELARKAVVIHNAVGNELVYSASEVFDRKKKISAVGRLTKQKDYPVLLRAFKIVLDKHTDYSLEIFGAGSDEADLKSLTDELSISKSVKFMGICKDAILKIADSSCYVMSSKYEGMPNALMEAMAVGLPCVSTDCPNGPAELINHKENGLLVPVGDPEAMAEAILRMIEDRDFAEKCGEKAKEILETHSIEKIAKEYMDYIERVLTERKNR